jgi:hypothetical protein
MSKPESKGYPYLGWLANHSSAKAERRLVPGAGIEPARL